MRVCTLFEREEKRLPIVLPSGWAVINMKKINLSLSFQRGFIKDETILSASDPTPTSIRLRAWGQKRRG